MNALIRYHFKMEPDDLGDEEYAMRWNELEWILRKLNQKGETNE